MSKPRHDWNRPRPNETERDDTMTRQSEYEHQLDRLRAVVAAYGGDVARWPVDDRTALAALVNTDPTAEAIVREGRQLDRLLDEEAA